MLEIGIGDYIMMALWISGLVGLLIVPKDKGIRIIALVFLISFYTIFIVILSGSLSYKRGQVDYANGKIQFELVQHPDKTMSWEFIKEEEEK